MEEQPDLLQVLTLRLSASTRRNLKQVSQWGKVCAVTGFIIIGLDIIQLIKSVGFGAYRNYEFVITTIITAAISFFLNLFLWRCASHLHDSLINDSQESFVVASANLKYFARMTGILLIASLALGIGTFLLVLAKML